MSDLISRDKAVAAVLGTSIEYQLIYGKKEPKEGFVRSLIKSLANIPQEETERKHGKWDIEIGDSMHEATYRCSECGHQFRWIYDQVFPPVFNYCKNCGAKMEVK